MSAIGNSAAAADSAGPRHSSRPEVWDLPARSSPSEPPERQRPITDRAAGRGGRGLTVTHWPLAVAEPENCDSQGDRSGGVRLGRGRRRYSSCAWKMNFICVSTAKKLVSEEVSDSQAAMLFKNHFKRNLSLFKRIVGPCTGMSMAGRKNPLLS